MEIFVVIIIKKILQTTYICPIEVIEYGEKIM